MESTIDDLMKRNEDVSMERLEELISTLPEEMREGVRMCHRLSGVKNKKSMRYSQRWILECLLLRVKSRKAYLHILNHKKIVLELFAISCVGY